MVVYGICAIILLLLCFATTRERVTPPAQQNPNIKSDLINLFDNKPWIVLVGVLLLTLAAFAVKGSVTAYYFKYFVHREDLIGLFLLSNGFAFIVAVSLTSYLNKFIGKKPLFMFALGAGG